MVRVDEPAERPPGSWDRVLGSRCPLRGEECWGTRHGRIMGNDPCIECQQRLRPSGGLILRRLAQVSGGGAGVTHPVLGVRRVCAMTDRTKTFLGSCGPYPDSSLGLGIESC
jgi:hypothetical protein